MRTVIVARLGDPFYIKKVLKGIRRPPKRCFDHGLHDSVVANPGPMFGHHDPDGQGHQEFVIFDAAQAYPCFVVQYAVYNRA